MRRFQHVQWNNSIWNLWTLFFVLNTLCKWFLFLVCLCDKQKLQIEKNRAYFILISEHHSTAQHRREQTADILGRRTRVAEEEKKNPTLNLLLSFFIWSERSNGMKINGKCMGKTEKSSEKHMHMSECVCWNVVRFFFLSFYSCQFHWMPFPFCEYNWDEEGSRSRAKSGMGKKNRLYNDNCQQLCYPSRHSILTHDLACFHTASFRSH